MSYTKEYAALSFPGQVEADAKRARALLNARFPAGARAFVHSYGCQQNVSDGQRLAGILEALGCAVTDDAAQADVILLNTCAVRENAENRVLGNIGAMKSLYERHPDLIIGVCGCMTQQPQIAEKLRRSYPHVRLVFGANAVHRLPALLGDALEGGRVIDASPPGQEFVEGLPVRRDSAVKAWLPIMQGCDNFCSYCIVPYVRGRERSRPPQEVLEEARRLIGEGYREITLLGQNVNSYGGDFGVDFPALLRRLNDLPGEFRLRFMTSHPKDCSAALIDAVAECEKVCSHIHLPVQSGSDRILRQMNRHYTAGEYLRLIDAARGRIPGVSFTSDILVGFPGETEEDFEQTLELVRRVRYTSLFTFLFSPRSGTRAASLPDPVPAEEKSRWFRRLLDVQEGIGAGINASYVGRAETVLAEGPGKEEGTVMGRTESGLIVLFPGGEELYGSFVRVRVNRALNWALWGEAV